MAMIRLDYGLARLQARRLKAAANECDSVSRFADTIRQEAKHSWRGEAEVQFEEKLREWRNEQQRIGDEIMHLATYIEKVVRDFEETEKRIKAEAAKGHGGGGGGSW